MKRYFYLLGVLALLGGSATASAEEVEAVTLATEVEAAFIEESDTSTTTNEEQVSVRASDIVLSTSWELDSNYCGFSIELLNRYSGSGIITLQKQSGSTWVKAGGIKTTFTTVRYIDGIVPVSSLSSGTYRLQIDITVGTQNQVYNTRTITI